MVDRRLFLQTAGIGLAAGLRAWGANEKVHIGIIGLGGRGQDHLKTYLALPNAEITALCDVNQAAVERSQAIVEKATGKKPKGYEDMRKLFDDKDVDAISSPTPNHWHALTAILGMQAGKDVYIEKPACHNVFEGRKMIEAARKYKRIVQVGSQSRTMPHKIKAIELLKQGAIGKVYMAKGLCYKRRLSIGHKPNTPTPPGVNWDLFLGPAPMRPFNELRFKYNWHWFWDTGNGDIGNQGVHEMDIARWGLGVGLPAAVVSTGGKFAYDDDQETPNTQNATFDYGDKQIVFEVRGLLTGAEGGLERRGKNTIGNLFYGSDGYMAMDNDGFRIFKGEELQLSESAQKGPGDETAAHMANFLAGVKSRNPKDLTAEVEIGVMSADLCHLANISYRLNRKLKFDPATEKFLADAEANRMLTRPYRAPYVVPVKV